MPERESKEGTASGSRAKWAVAAVLVAAAGFLLYRYAGDWNLVSQLAEREAALRGFQRDHPVLVYGVAFAVYVLAVAVSLPGAAAMTLVVGWYFGLFRGVILVSFASTTGATLAFLLSRYLFRRPIERRFEERARKFNAAFEREGAFYLFTLRLIPAVPFFVINAVMGLTRLRTWTFWWVSQVGMLPGTVVYTYAGSRIPDLQTIADEGARAVFSGWQLAQILFAFALLGLFPLVTKKLLERWKPNVVKKAEGGDA